MSLSDLEQAHYASPGLYKKLTDITLKIRNKYEPGRQLPKKLHLLKEWPNEELENKHPVEAVQDLEGDIWNEEEIDGGEKVEVETEGGQVLPDVENVENDKNEGAGLHMLDPENEDIEDGERRYKTRYRGLKHVPIFNVDVMRQNVRSILKCGRYNEKINQNIDLVRTLSKEAFAVHKQALIHHCEICHFSLCNICMYYEKIKGYSYDSKGYARYVMPLNTPKMKASRDRKTVRFQQTDLSNKQKGGFQINFAALEAACAYNVSLQETSLISELKYMRD